MEEGLGNGTGCCTADIESFEVCVHVFYLVSDPADIVIFYLLIWSSFFVITVHVVNFMVIWYFAK